MLALLLQAGPAWGQAERPVPLPSTYQLAEPSPEAIARRDRSHAQLRVEGVPILPSLPVIETEAETSLPAKEELLDRAVALTMVALKGEGLEEELLAPEIARWGADRAFTPAERAFMADPAPAEQDRVDFSWRYESALVLFWALGLVDELGRPDEPRDPAGYVRLVRDHTRDELLEMARPRPAGEVLDQADLIYRYRWAIVEAGLNGEEPPAGLHPGVAMEWHWALNWLVYHRVYGWDDIPLDT
jgi:Domain of unknown function (DUF4272)